MLVTLTYHKNSKKTVVNLDKAKTIYEVFNSEDNCLMTKVVFHSEDNNPRYEDFINVSESIEEIHNIINEIRNAGQQVVEFNQPVKQVIREGYDRYKRDRTYNREGSYNDTMWNQQ